MRSSARRHGSFFNFYNFILFTFSSAMERSEDQNLALVREILITEPYRFKARTTERGKVWEQIANNPNSDFPRRNSGNFRETGVIAGSTYFSFNKRSIRYQSSKTSRVFLKNVVELKDESITSSSLVRRALNATCSQGAGVLTPRFLRQTHVLFTAASRIS